MKQFIKKHKALIAATGGAAAVAVAAKIIPAIRQAVCRKQYDSIDIGMPDTETDRTETESVRVSAQNTDSTETADIVQEAAEAPSLDFMGFNFRPAGFLYDEDKSQPEEFAGKLGEGLFKTADRTRNYSAAAFYNAFRDNRADIFLCLDNNKYYIPGVSDMYEYTGTFRDYTETSETAVQKTGIYSNSTSDIRDSVLYGDPYPPFIYQGYEFKPTGYLYTRDRYQPRKLVKKLGEGLFGRKGRADDYSIWDFYSRYGNGKATVFLCKENHKYYIPCISDMQEFTGKIRIMGK